MSKASDKGKERRRQPIYRQIAGRLENAITSGKLPVGSKLPTEHQLVERYNVSRATAIAALDHLADKGYVYRRPRLGTEVVSRYPIRQIVTEGDTFHDWAHMGTEYKLEIVDREICDIPGALIEGMTAPSAGWLHLIGLRWAPDATRPMCVAEVYVHPAYVSISSKLERFPPRIFEMIENRYNVVVRAVHQELQAVSVTKTRAGLLQVAQGSPALEIVRWYKSSDTQLIEVTVDTHPSGNFRYRSQIQRGQLT